MKYLVRAITVMLAAFFAGCATQGYQAKSAAEAKAYARRAVEVGAVHAGGEQQLYAQKSAGLPAEGKWDPQKIEKYLAGWASQYPKRVEVNLAATNGAITESERLRLMSVLDMEETAERQREAAAMMALSSGLNATAAGLNATAASMNQSAAAMNRSSSMYRPTYAAPIYQAPSTIQLRPTYGGGYRGTITPGY